MCCNHLTFYFLPRAQLIIYYMWYVALYSNKHRIRGCGWRQQQHMKAIMLPCRHFPHSMLTPHYFPLVKKILYALRVSKRNHFHKREHIFLSSSITSSVPGGPSIDTSTDCRFRSTVAGNWITLRTLCASSCHIRVNWWDLRRFFHFSVLLL